MAFNNNNNNNNVGDNGNAAADAMDAMELMDDMDGMDDDIDQIALADLPPDTRVMTMPELAQHIIRYIPISSLQACSGINRMWRQLIDPLPRAFRDYQTAAQEQFESGPRRIHILSYFVLQYGPSVHSMNNSANSYQFIFSCQAQSGSVDSYGSTGSEGRRGGSSSGNYSGEGSSQSLLQRHHTHQPGHDLEPFRSFHTYQSSAIVPNVYFKTGFNPPPSHPSSPPPSLPSARPSAQSHHPSLQHNPAQQQSTALQASVSVTQPASSWQSIDQLVAHSSAHTSDSTHHSYEADVSTDSTSSIVLDVSDMSLSPAQLQSSTLAAGLARQSPVLRVVPCPYEHPSDGSISYGSRGSHPTKKDSGTSSGSGNSHETSGSSGGTADAAYLQGLNMVYSTVTASSSTATALPFPGPASASASASSSSSSSSSYTTGLSPPTAYGQYAGSSSAARPHTEPARSRHGKERSIEVQEQHFHALGHHLVQHPSPNQPGQTESSTDLSERMNLDTTSGGDSSDPQPFLAGIEGVPGATSSSSYSVTSTTTSLHQRSNAPSASLRRTSSSSNTSSLIRHHHHHHHHHQHHHQQHLQHHLQHQRPSRNWSMAVQTFYYMRAASNAMIAACREHMHSSEGQGGHIVEKTDTSRIIWNEATRQEHIWTITPTLMDRTNPGDFVERDYDADADVETEQSREDDTQGGQESG
ncbi:hypothetical protein BGZ67_007584 [Mortierella alpina]|nr:hypothetical protein BGZ67_007584 [Mortierella alpina]